MGSFILAGANVPFVAALVLMLLVGAAEVFGLGAGLAGGFNVDADLDAEAGDPSLLSWLNVGRLPFLMLLVVFLFSFGITGLVGQSLVQAVTGRLAPWFLAVPIGLAVAMPVTRLFAGLVAKVMPKDETSAVSRDSLVGRVAVITTGMASSASPAQARARDQHGQPHYVMVEPDVPGETFEQGASVIIVRRAGATYYAIRNQSASLQDAGA